ncbi:MAG: hypothetical protein ACTSPI_14265 [Candidatus Heimdallarchaeaceae archaeon]
MKVIQTCSCGKIKGKKTILADITRVGITTEFQDNRVFKNNEALYLENNYCSQCGKKYKVVNEINEQCSLE